MQLIDRTLGPDVLDLQEKGFARKWTEMDRNKYIIGTMVSNRTTNKLCEVKTSLIMDLWSATSAQNVAINENKITHEKAKC